MKRIILVITTLALACGLMLGTMGTATASTTQAGEGRGLFGTVEAVDISDNGTGVITLSNVKPLSATEDAATVEIAVTEATLYHIPTVTIAPKWQTWQQLTAESRGLVEDANRVAILLTDPASDRVAQKIMIVPAKGLHRYQHQLGVVTLSWDATEMMVGSHLVVGPAFVLTKRNGDEVIVTLGDGAELPEAGQVVILVTEKGTGEVQFRAVHAYRWEHMVQRFEGYLNGALDQDDFDKATQLMEQAHERHMDNLEALQNRLEERNRVQAAEMVGKAKEYAEARYAEAVHVRAQIQQRVQEAGGWEEWRAQWGQANGTIASINTQTRTMTLNTEGGPLTLEVAAGATITKNGNVYAFKGLKAGDVVGQVLYRTETNKAWFIELQ
ncbi:MAG: hypothetical protein JW753_09665 [Dehalococcoidia bacterium]|nr:hypothetical protein [Dehalococcoidia bacterium]